MPYADRLDTLRASISVWRSTSIVSHRSSTGSQYASVQVIFLPFWSFVRATMANGVRHATLSLSGSVWCGSTTPRRSNTQPYGMPNDSGAGIPGHAMVRPPGPVACSGSTGAGADAGASRRGRFASARANAAASGAWCTQRSPTSPLLPSIPTSSSSGTASTPASTSAATVIALPRSPAASRSYTTRTGRPSLAMACSCGGVGLLVSPRHDVTASTPAARQAHTADSPLTQYTGP